MLKTLSLLLFFNLFLSNCINTIEALNILSPTKNQASQPLQLEEIPEDLDLDEEFDSEETNNTSYFINIFVNQIQIHSSFFISSAFYLSSFSVSDYIAEIDFPPEF
jgi:hypothetical protein